MLLSNGGSFPGLLGNRNVQIITATKHATQSKGTTMLVQRGQGKAASDWSLVGDIVPQVPPSFEVQLSVAIGYPRVYFVTAAVTLGNR